MVSVCRAVYRRNPLGVKDQGGGRRGRFSVRPIGSSILKRKGCQKIERNLRKSFGRSLIQLQEGNWQKNFTPLENPAIYDRDVEKNVHSLLRTGLNPRLF
jgi:hypothetical protein